MLYLYQKMVPTRRKILYSLVCIVTYRRGHEYGDSARWAGNLPRLRSEDAQSPDHGGVAPMDANERRAAWRQDNIDKAAYLDNGGNPLRALEMWPQLYAPLPGNDATPNPHVQNEVAPGLDNEALVNALRLLTKLGDELSAQREQVKALTAWRADVLRRQAERAKGAKPSDTPKRTADSKEKPSKTAWEISDT